jgi:hypothetical protein
LLVTPNLFPFKPFLLTHPLDIAITNVSIISPLPLQSLTFGKKGLFSENIMLSAPIFDPGSYYAQLGVQFFVPMAYSPNIILSNINIKVNQKVTKELPLQFQLEENLGRLLFDGIHSYIVPDFAIDSSILEDFEVKIKGTKIQGGLNFNALLADRLETIYGNYYRFHEVTSKVKPKGYSMTQILAGMDLTEMLTSMIDLENVFRTSTNTSGEEGGDFNLEDSLALQQIFKGDNFYNPIQKITTDNFSYDLIKFFDGILLVDPEIPFNNEEITVLKYYMELGGNIFLFCENQTYEDINATNSLINAFNLEISNQTIGKVPLNLSTTLLKPNLNLSRPISLTDPLAFRIYNQSISYEHINFINEFLVQINWGNGNLILCGDANILNHTNQNKPENQEFITKFMNYIMDNRFKWETNLRDEKINLKANTYLTFNQVNESMNEFLDEDMLLLMNAADSKGVAQNLSLFGYDTPFLPLISTNETAFATQINSASFTLNSEIWIGVMADSPSALSESFTFRLMVTNITENPQRVEKYEEPPLGFPKILEIIFCSLIIFTLLSFYLYSTLKWKIRQQYVPINEDVKASIDTHLSTLNQSINRIKLGIDSTKLDEIEKIRYVMEEKDGIEKAMRRIFNLATELGEN